MKSIFFCLGMAFALLMNATLASTAKADPYDGNGVYSKATPNCVPAVTALFWYEPGYRLITARIREQSEFDLKDATPACWLGKVSKALGIKHRKLYLPSESRRIRAWFASHTE